MPPTAPLRELHVRLVGASHSRRQAGWCRTQPQTVTAATAHKAHRQLVCLSAVSSFVRACSWDNVEELSAAAAHKKVAYQDDKVASDPLEAFCDDNPDADECRWVPPRQLVPCGCQCRHTHMAACRVLCYCFSAHFVSLPQHTSTPASSCSHTERTCHMR